MMKPMRNCAGVWILVCGVGIGSSAFGQVAMQADQGATSGGSKVAVGASVEIVDEAVGVLWPYRRCDTNNDCPGNRYCLSLGECDDPGVCVRRPNACPDVWDPVCGCDGMTYGNKCEAAAAGVNVDFQGECPEICGGIAGVQCSDPGDFCKLNEGECCCDFQGVCTPIPVACPEFYSPVCGCDGVTYSNECFADAAGVSVDHVGACDVPCCDPADEPGVGGNPFCFEGASCCADGTWTCNNPDGTPSCNTGPVCEDQCCDPAAQPGVGGNPFCFEGASCCDDGTWTCNNPDGTPSCNTGPVCDPCCDPAAQPGVGGNPFCFEGASCCDDGTWTCNNPDGTPSCNTGPVCEDQCCDPAAQPGVGGNPLCFEGASCCDDGTWTCNNPDGTPSCNTGPVCDPCCDPAAQPGVGGNPACFEGASCCADGTWTCNNPDGSPSCDAGMVCDEIGKCCLEGGACTETTEAKCLEQCGVFSGAGTSCTGLLDCPIPPIVIAACCLPDGSCAETTECICDNRGGVWGNDPVCSATTCGGPEICGGFAGIQCSDPNDFCKLNEGECCCDFQGVCTPVPDLCPLIYAPVCGCDGVTYSNECMADAASVSVDHQGACASSQ